MTPWPLRMSLQGIASMTENKTVNQHLRRYWVPVTVLVAALVLALNPLPFRSPVRAAHEIPAWATDPTPVRRPAERPTYVVAGFTYRCSECHDLLPPRRAAERTPTQHIEITLRHGINNRCLNCHHPTERDAFVDALGQVIPWDQPPRLCAKCHGTTYRDWQEGTHGRTMYSWVTDAPEQYRLRCSECHDPHAPAFGPMSPLPGPLTMRMGVPKDKHEGGEIEHVDPLRKWRKSEAAHQEEGAAHEAELDSEHPEDAGDRSDQQSEHPVEQSSTDEEE